MSINERLKSARKNINLTQDEVEKVTGINKKTISNWENGVSRPDVDSVAILCSLYKVKPNDIFEWQEESTVHTIAAHHDGDNWSDEELEEIDRFKAFVLAKRKDKYK